MNKSVEIARSLNNRITEISDANLKLADERDGYSALLSEVRQEIAALRLEKERVEKTVSVYKERETLHKNVIDDLKKMLAKNQKLSDKLVYGVGAVGFGIGILFGLMW